MIGDFEHLLHTLIKLLLSWNKKKTPQSPQSLWSGVHVPCPGVSLTWRSSVLRSLMLPLRMLPASWAQPLLRLSSSAALQRRCLRSGAIFRPHRYCDQRAQLARKEPAPASVTTKERFQCQVSILQSTSLTLNKLHDFWSQRTAYPILEVIS